MLWLMNAAYLCGGGCRNWPTASGSFVFFLDRRGLLLQLPLLDQLQQGVTLLPTNHVVTYFKLLLGFAQPL